MLTSSTALNLLWLALSVSAFVWLVIWRLSCVTRPRVARRAVALAVAALALFPAISDSDDQYGFALLQGSLGGCPAVSGVAEIPDGEPVNNVQLARLFDRLEHYEPVSPVALLVAWGRASLSVTTILTPVRRAIPCQAGRSPPSV